MRRQLAELEPYIVPIAVVLGLVVKPCTELCLKCTLFGRCESTAFCGATIAASAN
jgi:hypothetical protein